MKTFVGITIEEITGNTEHPTMTVMKVMVVIAIVASPTTRSSYAVLRSTLQKQM